MSRPESLPSQTSHFSRFLGSVVARNAASSFICTAWLGALSILSAPLYMRLLGLSEWGIVAACASLQLVFNFFDAGFSQIVPRWVAREADDKAALQKYVRLFRCIYTVLALSGFLLLQLGAAPLAHSWFQVAADRADALEFVIRIIAFQMLFQFANSLHIGLWHGLQMQVLANVRNCGFGTLKHAAALAALALGPAQVWLYALVFAVVAAAEFACNYFTVRRFLGPTVGTGASGAPALTDLLRDAAVLSGGVLVGQLVSQLDRLILSRTLPVEEFGIYVLVANLALAFLQLQAPLTRAYFPLLVQDLKTGSQASRRNFRRMLLGNVVYCVLPVLLAALFAEPLLQVWLHDPKIVTIGHQPLQLLLLAMATYMLYNCIYQLIVASGQSHLVFLFNVAALLVVGSVVMALDGASGLLLGGAIWLSTALTQLLLGLGWHLSRQLSGRTEGPPV